ncbi:transglycosylase domain-containing protein [uncultured Ruminococcus sp.]|uniref:transglycosylase domain-containing protein n=1 Tax=uncultured Ruminococcus sp. TaxID=165186 RepID=UPI00262FA3AE|nr:transglycosylase domain-containing protein [uncultured Ruminococcus sp.]
MKDKDLTPSGQPSAEKEVRSNAPKKKKKKKHGKAYTIFKKLMTVIATTLLSLLLVIIITGTIVSTALTVYVLKFMDDSTSITLQQLESGSDTYFYTNHINEQGETELAILHRNRNDFQRLPITIDKIPQHVRNAFVYTEDERFYVHDGVDYKRTFSAFLNMFLHFYDTEQGGSTITQQLIKNLTGDKKHSPQRKIREIFAAMQLEKSYSKDEILEEYLNYISFGGAVNGIELASIRYFGKTTDQLTTPEAAVLAAIPKSPEDYGPFAYYHQDDDLTKPLVIDGRANNKPRQEYVLYKLYENGAISYDEYQEYIVTPLIYTDSPEYLAAHPEAEAQELEEKQKAYEWILDAAYFEAQEIFKEKFDLVDDDQARRKIDSGGYKIYTSYDEKMQKYVEEKFLDINNIIPEYSVKRYADLKLANGSFGQDGVAEEYLPHVAFVALNYDGEVLCAVGNIGEKTHSLVTNFAVKEPRQVGSTIKPVTTYGYGIESGEIHWGTMMQDLPTTTDEQGNPWPYNYGKAVGNGATHPIYYFLQQSFNTVPAQLFDKFGADNIYKFSTEKLGLKLSVVDKVPAAMALGSLTYGVTLENLVNAYLPYGNQGIYNEAHIITRIEDSNQQIIYENNGNPRQAVSDEAAWVMNRLLKNVVENGTGTAARLGNKVVCGKTGTTENWHDEAFVGLTRDFVSGITIGYDISNDALYVPSGVSANVWQAIIGEYANTMYPDTGRDFEPVKTVIEMPMCTSTGKIASQYCGKGVTGYWKSEQTETYSPPYCDGSHGYVSTGEGTTGANGGAAAGGGADTGAATGGDTGAGTGGDTGGYTGGGDTGAGTGGDTGGYTGGGDTGAGGGDTGGYTGGGDVGGGDTGGGVLEY